MRAILVGVSSKAKRVNTWNDVYVDQYNVDNQEFIKVFVTEYELKHKHFNLDRILIGNESYKILEKTFETKRDNIHDLLEDGTYTKDTFIDRLNKVEMEEQQVLELIASLNEKIVLEREKDSNLNRTLPAISNALEVFEQCDARQKNILLKSFIDKIMYTRTSKKEDFKLDISYHQ